MFKIYFSIWFLVFALASAASAHPPNEMELTYDIINGILIVKARHVVTEGDEHYIRRVVVYINDREYFSKQNRKQVDPKTFEMEIPVTANVNDIITVKAYCSEGGIEEATVVVPSEEEMEESQGIKENVPAEEVPAVPTADSPSVYP